MNNTKIMKKEENISTVKQGAILNIFFYIMLLYYVLKTLICY